MRRITWGALAVLVLLVSGCSDGGGSDDEASAPAGGGATLTVTSENISFDPTQLETQAGTVTLVHDNRDEGTPHNLHVTGDGVDESTEVAAGPVKQRLTVELSAGTYSYRCDVHPDQMQGELTVS